MNWFADLLAGETVAQAVAILGLVAVVGLGLGQFKVKGIGLGVAGVLFAGLGFAHFGVKIEHRTLEFAREFGLILFVYTIGMQVGPGFFGSLRRQGLPLNLLAIAIVLLGSAIAVGFNLWGHIPGAAVVGILSGAATNTPSLGAAQQALQTLPGTDSSSELPGLGYAVAYPFGVLGIIFSMIAVRYLFGIKIEQEEVAFQKSEANIHPTVKALNLRVNNPNLVGVPLGEIPGLKDSGVVVSRLEQDGIARVGRDEIILQLGNTLTVVGPEKELERLRMIVGSESEIDLRSFSGTINVRRIILTNKGVFGRSLNDLDLGGSQAVCFTRLTRAEVELPHPAAIRLQAGDVITAVGEDQALNKVANVLGDSFKELNQTQIISVFIGILFGVVLGSIPISFPGVPVPMWLGLAGGPLVAAILLSHLGRIGPFVWYMPPSANVLLRELGIVLFLACVGLKAGEGFVRTITEGDGLYWMFCGAVITLLPLLIVAAGARIFLKTNYLTLCGVIAGSMTDPPALAFANAATSTEAPAVSYAAVYPVTMLLRVVCAQTLVLFLD